MPLGINVSEDYVNNPPQRWVAVANGNDGPSQGRELEIACLLRFIEEEEIRNTV